MNTLYENKYEHVRCNTLFLFHLNTWILRRSTVENDYRSVRSAIISFSRYHHLSYVIWRKTMYLYFQWKIRVKLKERNEEPFLCRYCCFCCFHFIPHIVEIYQLISAFLHFSLSLSLFFSGNIIITKVVFKLFRTRPKILRANVSYPEDKSVAFMTWSNELGSSFPGIPQYE